MGSEAGRYNELYECACNVEEFLRRVTAWTGSDEEELTEVIEAAERLAAELEPQPEEHPQGEKAISRNDRERMADDLKALGLYATSDAVRAGKVSLTHGVEHVRHYVLANLLRTEASEEEHEAQYHPTPGTVGTSMLADIRRRRDRLQQFLDDWTAYEGEKRQTAEAALTQQGEGLSDEDRERLLAIAKWHEDKNKKHRDEAAFLRKLASTQQPKEQR